MNSHPPPSASPSPPPPPAIKKSRWGQTGSTIPPTTSTPLHPSTFPPNSNIPSPSPSSTPSPSPFPSDDLHVPSHSFPISLTSSPSPPPINQNGHNHSHNNVPLAHPHRSPSPTSSSASYHIPITFQTIRLNSSSASPSLPSYHNNNSHSSIPSKGLSFSLSSPTPSTFSSQKISQTQSLPLSSISNSSSVYKRHTPLPLTNRPSPLSVFSSSPPPLSSNENEQNTNVSLVDDHDDDAIDRENIPMEDDNDGHLPLPLSTDTNHDHNHQVLLTPIPPLDAFEELKKKYSLPSLSPPSQSQSEETKTHISSSSTSYSNSNSMNTSNDHFAPLDDDDNQDDDFMNSYGADDEVDFLSSSPSLLDASSPSLSSASSRRKRREIPVTDLSHFSFPPFTKCFWSPPPSITSLSDDEISHYREESLGGVKVTGVNIPRPIKSWIDAALPMDLYSQIEKLKYSHPFPVQCESFPTLMSGRDALIISQTGTGKSFAFLIPLIRHVSAQPKVKMGEGPIGMILVPTRELAIQLYHEGKSISSTCGIRLACLYGGSNVSEQISLLKRGVEIVISTPGRLIDLLSINGGKILNLRRITFIIIDEADRMMDLGFEPQIEKIIGGVRSDRQLAMFSATFPTVVEKAARKYLHNSIQIVIGEKSIIPTNITQVVEVISADSKYSRLLDLLSLHYNLGQILIFVDSQDGVDHLYQSLLKTSFSILSTHGGMDQTDRDNTLIDFKNKVKKILLATSIVSRGLDVRDLAVVINFDSPNHYEDYIHRVGRTGRAGAKGLAITLVEPHEVEEAAMIAKALRNSGVIVSEEIEKMEMEWKRAGEKGGADGKRRGGGRERDGYKTKGYHYGEREGNAKKKETQRLTLMSYDGDDGHGQGNDNGNDDERNKEGEDGDEEKDEGRRKKRKYNENQKSSSSSSSPPLPPPVVTVDDHIAAAKSAISAMLLKTDEQKEEEKRNMTMNHGESSTAMAIHSSSSSSLSFHSPSSPISPSLSTSVTLLSSPDRPKLLQQAPAARNFIPRGAQIVEKGSIKEITVGNNNNNNISSPSSSSLSSLSSFSSSSSSSPSSTKLYQSEVEINDWPQQSRWSVTKRGALDSLISSLRVTVTPKGVYFPPGSTVGTNQRKLYLLLEGMDANLVAKAKSEIIRMMKETSEKINKSQSMGKYSVV